MQYSIQNLGLTVPGQQKAQGYFTSVGTSMGFGERPDGLNKMTLGFPGPATYPDNVVNLNEANPDAPPKYADT